ncbi:hypothetical protein, partial [Nocardia brasiliensis]|uniref:hypothetical protein n=1 Tax=Nocardia brasiliensis TaxID=37326 RepID=UPI0024539196
FLPKKIPPLLILTPLHLPARRPLCARRPSNTPPPTTPPPPPPPPPPAFLVLGQTPMTVGTIIGRRR